MVRKRGHAGRGHFAVHPVQQRQRNAGRIALFAVAGYAEPVIIVKADDVGASLVLGMAFDVVVDNMRPAGTGPATGAGKVFVAAGRMGKC